MSMLIFEKGSESRYARAQVPKDDAPNIHIPSTLLRKTPLGLPHVSELEVVRHYTRLSQKNFSIDTQFYPLGSCTMKYNPRGVGRLAMLEGFLERHPLSPLAASQGFLQCLFELQAMLAEITGMPGVSLTPMAGAQGEFAGCAMIKAYHDARGDSARCEILVPDAAHGTNPATAIMCGYKVREVPTNREGDVDIEALKAAVGPHTAGIMLTNPSTLGVFERQIKQIADIVHQAGGLLYYDGANLNAILGKVRPGDMGFDVMHLNLHKTFATPHGGGGPGAGPVACAKHLMPFLPKPTVVENAGQFAWSGPTTTQQSIGRLSAFMGNANILLRAYIYIRLLGHEGLHRVAEFATLNANYLMICLKEAGFDLAFPTRRASHEFILTFKTTTAKYGVTAMDIAKRLLDHDFHAPTTYFPLLVPECWLLEPTETESKQVIDRFVQAMIAIKQEIETDPQTIKQAPHCMVVSRLDDVKAARELDLAYQAEWT